MEQKLKECPFCGEQPEEIDDGSNIYIECCVSMSLQKCDELTLKERGTWDNMTYRYSTLAEKKVKDILNKQWNTRHQPTEVSDPISVIQEKQDRLFVQEVMKPEVSELQAERDKLKEALKIIANTPDEVKHVNGVSYRRNMDLARKALTKEANNE